MADTVYHRVGVLYVPTSALPPPPPPPPAPVPVGACGGCGVPMLFADRPVMGYRGPTGWRQRYWVCKCGECYECPKCQADDPRPHGCPKCGEGCEKT